jgi:hypothetical protein
MQLRRDQSINGARCVCLECSAGEFEHTLDLCLDCAHKSVHRTKDGKHHTPSHHLMLLRRPRSRRAFLELQRVARRRSHEAEDAGQVCHLCKKVVTRFSWLCVECPCTLIIEATYEIAAQNANTLLTRSRDTNMRALQRAHRGGQTLAFRASAASSKFYALMDEHAP